MMKADKAKLRPAEINVTRIQKASAFTRLRRPLFQTRVSAGFPSPAENEFGIRLDFNQRFIRHPAATFYVQVSGDSMIERGIEDGAILLIDRAEQARSGDIIIARINSDFCIRILRKTENSIHLEPANPKYRTIEITPETDFEVYGRVMLSIQQF